jgi:hypothetical protein
MYARVPKQLGEFAARTLMPQVHSMEFDWMRGLDGVQVHAHYAEAGQQWQESPTQVSRDSRHQNSCSRLRHSVNSADRQIAARHLDWDVLPQPESQQQAEVRNTHRSTQA